MSSSSTDEELFDFDETLLFDYDAAKAWRDLEKYGDAFRFQLIAARHLAAWADRLEPGLPAIDEKYIAGYVEALRQVAAHLRQGSYLPGGPLYEEGVATKPAPETRERFYLPSPSLFGQPDAFLLFTSFASALKDAGLAWRFPPEADVRNVAIELLAERHTVESLIEKPALIDEAVAEARAILAERQGDD